MAFTYKTYLLEFENVRWKKYLISSWIYLYFALLENVSSSTNIMNFNCLHYFFPDNFNENNGPIYKDLDGDNPDHLPDYDPDAYDTSNELTFMGN